MTFPKVITCSLAFALGTQAYPSPNLNLRQTSAVWQPAVGTSWNYPIGSDSTSTNTYGISVWDIDLFGATKSQVTGLQANGAKVICYFSAGSSENWRPDFKNFTDADQGADLDGWAGERWLNTNSQNVRNIMAARIQMAKDKGCNGVDPDNMDAYNNGGGGLKLTQTDAVSYARFLAANASALGLSVGLKNAGEIIPQVIDVMQWSVNEQCIQYTECDTYAPFIQAGKPVFNVEYPKGDDTSNDQPIAASKLKSICDQTTNKDAGFSTIVKNIDLDGWIEFCNGTSVTVN